MGRRSQSPRPLARYVLPTVNGWRPRLPPPAYRLPHIARMRLDGPLPLLATATAAASASILGWERRRRRAAERLAAATFETLLNAVEANDPQTGQHVRRVARYSLVLAEAMGLTDRECHAIERVALFHDIGKIDQALFDIVHDDHKLTAAERREVSTHPARGAAVLTPLAEFYPELTDGVLAHHERWDGSGYPNRLKGRRIPLAARIVAVADTFDAVAQSRRYSVAKGTEVARTVICEGRATQFDPDLVDLFVLPPVYAQFLHVHRAGKTKKSRRTERRDTTSSMSPRAPDVDFRWRTTSPPPPASTGAT